jgi:hypothetical protein
MESSFFNLRCVGDKVILESLSEILKNDERVQRDGSYRGSWFDKIFDKSEYLHPVGNVLHKEAFLSALLASNANMLKYYKKELMEKLLVFLSSDSTTSVMDEDAVSSLMGLGSPVTPAKDKSRSGRPGVSIYEASPSTRKRKFQPLNAAIEHVDVDEDVRWEWHKDNLDPISKGVMQIGWNAIDAEKTLPKTSPVHTVLVATLTNGKI